jgi:membrane-associated phospholipid phosphatase
MRLRTTTPIIPFLIPTLLLTVGIGIGLCTIPKAELHLMLCKPHTPFLDALVPTFSNLVDWLPYFVVVVLLFYRAGWATFLASNLLLTTLIVQPIKHIVEAPRPITWFGENYPTVSLPLVEGVSMKQWLSFPSGHTATAFMGAQFLYEEYKDVSPWIGYAGFTIAAATGYLRIYNHRHYLNDVIAGACVGILSTKLAYWLYPKIFKKSKCNNDVYITGAPYYSKEGMGINMAVTF